MATDPQDVEKPLVYLSRLSSAERRALVDLGRALPSTDLAGRARVAEGDVVLDRLILAENMLGSAREAAAGRTEPGYRVAVNRAYYAIHHAARAVILRETHQEADGHAEAIKKLKQLLADASFRLRAGLTEKDLCDIGEARDNRSVADYSPYAYSRREGTTVWIPITGRDWAAAAEFNVSLAERMLGAAAKAVGLA